MSLSIIAMGVGAALFFAYAAGLFRTDMAKRFLQAFPRSRFWGILLATVDIAWVSYELRNATQVFEFFRPIQPHTYLLGAIALAGVIFLMDELLAPRALGGFLLLLAAPLLNAARWHPSQWRLVVTVFAYVLAIKGMVFVLSPFRFRHGVEWLSASVTRWKVSMVVGLIFSLVLVGLGVFVY